jgi:predicted GH43/DUF377 family glycosyl hydrolase
LVYRTGLAMFDPNDPSRLLSRADHPVFSAETEWERIGQVPNVVFVEGIAENNGRYFLYYGGADKYIGLAEASLP